MWLTVSSKISWFIKLVFAHSLLHLKLGCHLINSLVNVICSCFPYTGTVSYKHTSFCAHFSYSRCQSTVAMHQRLGLRNVSSGLGERRDREISSEVPRWQVTLNPSFLDYGNARCRALYMLSLAVTRVVSFHSIQIRVELIRLRSALNCGLLYRIVCWLV